MLVLNPRAELLVLSMNGLELYGLKGDLSGVGMDSRLT